MTTKRDFVKTITATIASLLLAGVAQADPVAQLSYDYDPAIRTPVPIPQSELPLAGGYCRIVVQCAGRRQNAGRRLS